MKTRHLLPFTLFTVAAPLALATTITWDGNGANNASGTWSNADFWDIAVPGASDTAVLTDVTADRTIVFDAAAPAAVQQIDFNQSTAGAANILELQRSAISVTNAMILGAGSGIERISFNTATNASTLTAPGGITLNAGGELSLSAYLVTAGGVNYGNVTSNVTISGGTLQVRATDNTNTVTSTSNNLNGGLTMSAGSLVIDNLTGQADRRLAISGNVNITGGSISSTKAQVTGALFFNGATAVLNPESHDLDLGVTLGGGSAQSLTTNVSALPLTLRGTGIKSITSTATDTIIGALAMMDGNNAVTDSRTTLKLESNLTLKVGGGQLTAATFGQSPQAGRIDLGVDTNGFTLDLSPAGSWTPNTGNVTGNAVWDISGAGTIKANSFNFSTNLVTTNVGAGIKLVAAGGNSVAINLGGVGTIDPTSSLTYTGTATATTPATLTTNRGIGDLVVNGTGALKLLATSMTDAYQKNITISKGALIVEANSLLGGSSATPIKLSDGTSTTNSRIILQFGDGVTIDRHIDVSAPLGPGPLGTGADSNNQRPRIVLSSGAGAVSSEITYGLAGAGAATVLELVAVEETSVLTVSGQIKAPVGQTLARGLLINGGNGGRGTVVLSNPANSYTGGTTITRGTLVLTGDVPASGDSMIGTGALNFADGATPEDETIYMLLNGPHTFARASNLATNSSVAGTQFTAVIGIADTATGNAVWSGNIGSNNDTRKKTLRITAPGASSILFSGVIAANAGTGVVALDKTGAGTVELTGANTYDGDTTVTEGTLKLADNAQLKFIIGDASGTNNTMTGNGTAVIEGDFVIDTTAAAALTSGSWTLENVTNLTGAYGSTFSIVDFTDAGGDKWTKDGGDGKTWTFDETTGVLTLSSDTLSPYETWIATFPQIPLADRDPGDDPDGDGSPNLLEFALKGDPATGSNNGLYASLIQDSSNPVGNEFTLVAAVRDGATFTNGTAMISGITYTVEGSLDLVFPASEVSSTGPSDTAPAATGLPSLAGTDWEYHTFKLVASEGLAGKGFLRIKVSQP